MPLRAHLLTCTNSHKPDSRYQLSGAIFLWVAGDPPKAPGYALFVFNCSQLWLPTVQLVLQADWQEVWHSPQPPFFADSFKFLVVRVLILATRNTPFSLKWCPEGHQKV